MRGTVRLPGSKSLTARYLVLAALATNACTLRGALDSRDTRLMRAALTALGARFEDLDDGALRVHPLPVGEPLAEEVHLDVGLAGTVMRFVPLVAALRPGTVHVDGDPEARVRPMGPILEALRGLGVDVQEHGERDRLPLTLTSPPMPAGAPALALDASDSSQFLTAALLIGAALPGGVHVRHTGQRVPSPEHVRMTLATLSELGVQAEQSGAASWHLSPGRPEGFTVTVEPDLSNAGPFLCAAVVTGGEVSVPDWPATTTQIGGRWREILPGFGAHVEFLPQSEDARTGTLRVRGGVDDAGQPQVPSPGTVADTAELAPTVAALALLAAEPTALTGIGHLRGHETDRLRALTAEAARFGVTVTEGPTALQFPGTVMATPQASTAHTYHDHRMATFAAVVGLRVPGMLIQNVATTAKTMPDFPQMWATLVSGEAGAGDEGRGA